MLFEVIYALGGFPGDVVVAQEDDAVGPAGGKVSLRLVNGIPLLEESERDSISRMLVMGEAAMEIEAIEKAEARSLYVASVVEFAKTTLSSFYEDLLTVEGKIRSHQLCGTTALELSLRPWQHVLPLIAGIVRKAFREEISGPNDLLQCVKEHSEPYQARVEAEDVVRKLEEACVGPLRMQLNSLLLHGMIVDPYDEFFACSAIEGGDQRFRLEEARIPKFLGLEAASSLLHASEVFAKMRESNAAIDTGAVIKLIDRLLSAASNFERDVAISKVEEFAAAAMGSVVDLDSIDDLFTKVRNYFLLGHGSFWDLFLQQVEIPMEIGKANRIAEELGHEELKFARYGEHITAPMLNPIWPLSELLREEEEGFYSEIFDRLLSLRTSSSNLQGAWLALHRRGIPSGKNLGEQPSEDGLQGSCQMLRSRIQFLLDNLIFYFHTDVIDSYYDRLVQNQKDLSFQALVKMHRNALSDIYIECFLKSRVIGSALADILEQSQQLVNLLKERERSLRLEEPSRMKDMMQRVESLQGKFTRSSGLLFQLLSSVKAVQGSASLARLILRLDWNNHYNNLIT